MGQQRQLWALKWNEIDQSSHQAAYVVSKHSQGRPTELLKLFTWVPIFRTCRRHRNTAKSIDWAGMQTSEHQLQLQAASIKRAVKEYTNTAPSSTRTIGLPDVPVIVTLFGVSFTLNCTNQLQHRINEQPS